MVNFVQIWVYYITAVQPWVEMNPLFGELFNFVLILNVGISVMYSVFPIVFVAQQIAVYRACSKGDVDKAVDAYRVGELWFVIASFLAKGFLIGTVLGAAFNRPN